MASKAGNQPYDSTPCWVEFALKLRDTSLPTGYNRPKFYSTFTGTATCAEAFKRFQQTLNETSGNRNLRARAKILSISGQPYPKQYANKSLNAAMDVVYYHLRISKNPA